MGARLELVSWLPEDLQNSPKASKVPRGSLLLSLHFHIPLQTSETLAGLEMVYEAPEHDIK